MLILYSDFYLGDSIGIFMRYPCLKIMSVFRITLNALEQGYVQNSKWTFRFSWSWNLYLSHFVSGYRNLFIHIAKDKLNPIKNTKKEKFQTSLHAVNRQINKKSIPFNYDKQRPTSSISSFSHLVLHHHSSRKNRTPRSSSRFQPSASLSTLRNVSYSFPLQEKPFFHEDVNLEISQRRNPSN